MAASKGGHGGHIPQLEALPPLAPPPPPRQKKKMARISHFRQIFGFLPPQNRILPPRCPPHKKFWCRRCLENINNNKAFLGSSRKRFFTEASKNLKKFEEQRQVFIEPEMVLYHVRDFFLILYNIPFNLFKGSSERTNLESFFSQNKLTPVAIIVIFALPVPDTLVLSFTHPSTFLCYIIASQSHIFYGQVLHLNNK